MKRSTSAVTLAPLALALVALTAGLAPGAAHAQAFGPTVVEAFFVEDAPPGPGPLFDTRRGRCGGVVDAAQSELTLHCGHNFIDPVTVTLFQQGSGDEILRQEGLSGDLSLTLELSGKVRQELRRGEIGIRVETDQRVATGPVLPPASATTGSVRLDVDLLDADGAVGGTCTALMLGIGTPFGLFDLYMDCDHDLDGPVTAGIFDRNPQSRLHTGADGLISDLGDARSPVLLDWRIRRDQTSPVGGFFGGSQEVVVAGQDRELRAFLDGCLSGGESVCLLQRFQVSTRYVERISGDRLRVPGKPVSFSPEAALFFFDDPEQVEVVVNLDNRCGDTGFFRLRASTMSKQRPRITVLDTVTGVERKIDLFRRPGQGGPPGEPIAVTDSQAFRCE